MLKQKNLELLKKYGLKPRKNLGQNFLISEIYFHKILSELKKMDSKITLMEVGPGPGILTKELSEHFEKIIIVEKDKDIFKLIENELREEIKNKKINPLNQDILKFNPKEHNLKNFKFNVFGNIPYYLTSALIRKFLESELKPRTIYLTTQKEVAQRITDNPDSKSSILGLSVRFYADAKILFYIPKNAFWPQPKVDSAFIKITPKKLTPETMEIKEIFFKTVKAAFSSPRKQIKNNLLKTGIDSEKLKSILEKEKISEKSRPENLSLEEFIALSKSIY